MVEQNKDMSMKLGDEINLSEQTEVHLDANLKKNEYPEITPGHQSLMAKYLTKDMWAANKDKKTTNGFTMARAVNSGVLNTKSLVGCHAGDEETYTLFAEFFDKVIEDYHGGYKADAKHPTNMNPADVKGKIDDPSLVISTRIRVARNIEGFNLAPNQDDLAEKLKIEELAKKVLSKLTGDLKGTYYPLDGMKEDVREDLIRSHFLFKGNGKMQADSGYHKWFPKGRGIFHNEARTFLVWVNEGDHLRIISMEDGGNVTSVFDRLARAVNEIQKLVHEETGKGFQRNDHLGMLTCCPSNLGTGLRGGVLIKVPKLYGELGEAKFKEVCAKYHLQARGLYGEHSETKDGIFDISNKYRLGYSEVQLVQFMVDGVNAVTKLENEKK